VCVRIFHVILKNILWQVSRIDFVPIKREILIQTQARYKELALFCMRYNFFSL